ncbi:hypothetical protein RCDURKIN_114 [Rhodobacter phage RcDurkin]|nr:hypothetical protein RCDURKIN_114 [Rhodobacter phage RcDurkin]QXN72583.1 hypothetical protein RCTIPTONUS_113 [Rhodobacter phage RcTiptonus]UUV43858.1 hypothetical protein RCKICKAPOO_117 [Rhodobacter phage RcKickapoo]UUV44484.1 hypothetical protein RCMENCHIE_115 [Rhodobacter phage RcMenchie]
MTIPRFNIELTHGRPHGTDNRMIIRGDDGNIISTHYGTRTALLAAMNNFLISIGMDESPASRPIKVQGLNAAAKEFLGDNIVITRVERGSYMFKGDNGEQPVKATCVEGAVRVLNAACRARKA